MQENIEYKILKDEYEDMTAFEICKNAFGLILNNLKILRPYLIAVSIGVLAIAFMFPVYLMYKPGSTTQMPETFVFISLFIGIYLFCFSYWLGLQAKLIVIRCSSKLLRGEEVDIKNETETVKPKMIGYLALNLAIAFVVIMAHVVFLSLGFMMSFNPIVMGIFAAIICAIFAVFFILHVVFAHQIYALNNIGGIDALLESFKFTREKQLLWPICCLGAIIWLVSFLINLVFGFIPIIGSIFASLVNALFITAVSQMAFTHLYLQTFVQRQEY